MVFAPSETASDCHRNFRPTADPSQSSATHTFTHLKATQAESSPEVDSAPSPPPSSNPSSSQTHINPCPHLPNQLHHALSRFHHHHHHHHHRKRTMTPPPLPPHTNPQTTTNLPPPQSLH